MEWSFRPAVFEDLAKVRQIEKKVHRSPWTEEQFQAELDKPYSYFWVCTDDETDSEISAYIVFWMLFEECQVLNVVVDLPHRGLGLAKSMLRKCASLAMQKEIKKIDLDVRKSNLPAIQLYQAMGFSIVHIRKGFYGDGEDAYHMALFLEGDGIPEPM